MNTSISFFFCNLLRLLAKFGVVCAVVLVLPTGCIKNEQERGYVKQTASFDAIEVGKTHKDEVVKVLGSPSSISNYGDETWYYITTHMEQMAFLEPKVTDQTVVYFRFNAEGIVTEKGDKSLEDRKNIKFAKETTPTEGNRFTVMQQLLGNFGKFNPKAEKD